MLFLLLSSSCYLQLGTFFLLVVLCTGFRVGAAPRAPRCVSHPQASTSLWRLLMVSHSSMQLGWACTIGTRSALMLTCLILTPAACVLSAKGKLSTAILAANGLLMWIGSRLTMTLICTSGLATTTGLTSHGKVIHLGAMKVLALRSPSLAIIVDHLTLIILQLVKGI